jgi:hypothetical protein
MAVASAGGWRRGKRGDFVGGIAVKVEDRPTAWRSMRTCCLGLERITACSYVEAFLSLTSSYLSVGPGAFQERIERGKVELAEA